LKNVPVIFIALHENFNNNCVKSFSEKSRPEVEKYDMAHFISRQRISEKVDGEKSESQLERLSLCVKRLFSLLSVCLSGHPLGRHNPDFLSRVFFLLSIFVILFVPE